MKTILARLAAAFSVLSFVGSAASQVNPTPTPTPTAGPPSDLASYVVFGLTSTGLSDQSFVAEGSAGVNNGTLTFGKGVFMPNGSVTAAGTCKADTGTSVFNLFSNNPPTPGYCAGLAPGICAGIRATPTGLVTPIVTAVPALPTFYPSPASIPTFPPTQPPRGACLLQLPRGAYGDVVVPQKCELELTVQGNFIDPNGGDYEFLSLTVDKYGKVRVDAPATINIQNGLTLQEFGSFGPNVNPTPTPNISPLQIHVNSGCGLGKPAPCTTIVFTQASHVGMALFAPYAQLNLDRSVRAKGQFIASVVNGAQTLLLRAARTPVAQNIATFTTYTQEDYATGNVALSANVFPLTLGAPGIRSLVLKDAGALHCVLPATGNPAALCATMPTPTPGTPCSAPGCMTIDDQCDNVMPDGQGGGQLTGQVIAAKLNVALNPALGDFVLPACLCTDICTSGRMLDNTNQLQQGPAAGVEDGLTTVNDLLAFGDEALSSDCSRTGVCSDTCGTAFAPPDPIRIGEMAWALQAVNECFKGGASVQTCSTPCPTPLQECH